MLQQLAEMNQASQQAQQTMFQQAMQAMQKVVQTVEATVRSVPQGARKTGDSLQKCYTRVEKFMGDPLGWKEWHYQFGVATAQYDQKTHEVMEKVEKMEFQDITTERIMHELETEDATWMDGTKAGLFGALGMLTSGEANVIVRSCEDKNGYTAWKKLYDRYNPKTPAGLTAAWRDVIRIKKAKDVREAGRNIDVWEGKVTLLKKEHGEEPTMGLKASLLLEMLPEGAQMTILQGMDTKKLDYEALKGKIKMMANIQIDNATPKPMDIGEMKRDLEEAWHDFDYGEEYDVDEVGAQSCHRCGGIGHFARECGTAKGKGKDGAKGKGKSIGKGWNDKGKGKGQFHELSGKSGGKGKGCFNCGGNHFARECPKGNGKGKGVVCYTCGGQGHRAAQCPTTIRAVEQEDEYDHEEGDGKIANVRVISEIKGQQKWQMTAKKKPNIGTYNRFEALTDDKRHDDEEYWVQGVTEGPSWKSVGMTEIVIDSAADESVCPKQWGRAFKTKPVAENQRIKLRSANGGKIEHYGEKVVCFKAGEKDDVKGMKFQVCDVQRPLAAVWRLVEQGNVVQFGPKPEDNYIWDPQAQEKIAMRKKGRSFVVDADMVRPGDSGSSFTRQA